MTEVDLVIKKLPIEISIVDVLSLGLKVEKVEVVEGKVSIVTSGFVCEDKGLGIDLNISQVINAASDTLIPEIELKIEQRYAALAEELFALDCASKGYYYLTSTPYPLEIFEEAESSNPTSDKAVLRNSYYSDSTVSSGASTVSGILRKLLRTLPTQPPDETQASGVIIVNGALTYIPPAVITYTVPSEDTESSPVAVVGGSLVAQLVSYTQPPEESEDGGVTLIGGTLE